MHAIHANLPSRPQRAHAQQLAVFSWGLFFIWIGTAFMADVGWPVGVLGVGVIAVGTQLARLYLGLRVEGFGLVIGIAMVAWGGWHVLGMRLGLVSIPGDFMPVVFIALGVALVLRALFRRDRNGEDA